MARYIVRFDDLCPTMKWATWDQIEDLLVELNLRPVLAVIPDNRLPKFKIDPPRPDFWDRVRSWAERNWSIGVHGYQHTYSTDDPGILGLNTRSEFAGLGRAEQARRIGSAVEVFVRHGITPTVWIAPANSFDDVTLEVAREAGLAVVSDGFGPFPFVDNRGTTWVPQQMWRFRSMPFGWWTVGFHPNSMDLPDVDALRTDLNKFRHRIVSLPDAVAFAAKRGGPSWWEPAWNVVYRALLRRKIEAPY